MCSIVIYYTISQPCSNQPQTPQIWCYHRYCCNLKIRKWESPPLPEVDNKRYVVLGSVKIKTTLLIFFYNWHCIFLVLGESHAFNSSVFLASLTSFLASRHLPCYFAVLHSLHPFTHLTSSLTSFLFGGISIKTGRERSTKKGQ